MENGININSGSGESPETWDRWAFKHVAGMGLGAIVGAGLGVGFGLYKGSNLNRLVKNSIAGGTLGVIGSIGFGHEMFDESVGRLAFKPKSFAERILAERQPNVGRSL